MTFKDQPHADDAEFALFLQGQQELSRRLKSLHQPGTSTEMDASILAIIEAELASESMPAKAANDPVGPSGANAMRPRFLSRWKVPMGLAAGVLLTVLVYTHREAGELPVLVAQAPQAVDTPTSNAKTTAVEPPVSIASSSLVAPVDTTKPSASGAPAKAHKGQAHQHTPKTGTTPPNAPIMMAQADIPSVYVTGIRASLQQQLSQKRNADSHVEVITAEDVGKMPDKNVADSLQRVPGVTISSAGAEEGGFNESANRIDVISGDEINFRPPGSRHASPESAKPVAAPAPYSPPLAIVAPPPVAEPGPAEDLEKAKAWLARITEKLKAGSNRDALEEWTKFRKIYPSYPVPPSISEQISALQKP